MALTFSHRFLVIIMRYRILFSACFLFLIASCTEPSKKEATTQETGAAETEAQLVARALEIHDRVLTMDTHADTPLRMIEPGFDMSVRHDPNESGSKVDYPRMIEGGLDSIFFATFVAQNIRDDEGDSRAKALAMQMIDATIESTLENADTVGLALTPDDAIELERQGKRAVYIAMENGYPIGSDLANVEVFYDKGVRYITLVHSTNNDLADSSTDSKGPEHEGLSQFGEEVVKEMNDVDGLTVNLSADSLSEADQYADLDIAPVCVTLPNDAPHRGNKTPKGLPIVVCPAQTQEDMSCSRCQLCQIKNRKSIVGFLAHGTAGKRLSSKLNEENQTV